MHHLLKLFRSRLCDFVLLVKIEMKRNRSLAQKH